MNKNSQAGFTLIEMMVVAAIIGIIAAMAIPNFTRLQQRSRTKEAQALLSDYYRSARVMTAEYGFNPGNFIAIGFNPEGSLTYKIMAADNTDNPPPGYPDGENCVSTEEAHTGCVNVWDAYVPIWSLKPSASSELNDGAQGDCRTTPSVTPGGPEFKAVACAGFVQPQNDEWTIDHMKVLKNDIPGF